jgi:prepilin-type N-terminal cleavage/methylation domain-containing protein
MKAIRKIHWRKNSDHQEGFTLVELLVVIVILGILAAIVVFAVTGITGNGQKSACSVDAKTIQAAEEAAYAQQQTSTAQAVYLSMNALQTGGFLHSTSGLWQISTATSTGYTLVGQGNCQGVTPP